jgi:excisionase family DNA binding protein
MNRAGRQRGERTDMCPVKNHCEPRGVGSPITPNVNPLGAQLGSEGVQISQNNQGHAELPLLLTIKQTTQRMGLKDGQVRKLIRDGRLAHVKVGSRFMVPRGAIEQFVIDNTVQSCREEIPVPGYAFSNGADAFTSAGLNQAAAGSAARALKIASKLKSPLPNSSTPEFELAAPGTHRTS